MGSPRDRSTSCWCRRSTFPRWATAFVCVGSSPADRAGPAAPETRRSPWNTYSVTANYASRAGSLLAMPGRVRERSERPFRPSVGAAAQQIFGTGVAAAADASSRKARNGSSGLLLKSGPRHKPNGRGWDSYSERNRSFGQPAPPSCVLRTVTQSSSARSRPHRMGRPRQPPRDRPVTRQPARHRRSKSDCCVTRKITIGLSRPAQWATAIW